MSVRRAATLIAAALTTLLCAACSAGAGNSATAGTGPSGSTPSSTAPLTAPIPKVCGSCTPLAAAAALPTAAQLGKGWKHDQAEDYTANFLVNETVAPARCQQVVTDLAPLLPYENPTSAQATYLHNAPYGPYLNVVVSSHPNGAPSLEQFAALAHAFATCRSFSTHDPYGTVASLVVASRWSPATRTFTAQLRANVHGHPEWNDLVLTQKGMTTVEVWDTTAGPPTMRLVTTVDRQTLARVHT